MDKDDLYPEVKSFAEMCAESRQQCRNKTHMQGIKAKICCDLNYGRDQPKSSCGLPRIRRLSDSSLHDEDLLSTKASSGTVRFCVSSPHLYIHNTNTKKPSGGILKSSRSKQIEPLQHGEATPASNPRTCPRQVNALVLPPLASERRKPFLLKKELSTLQVGYIVFSKRDQERKK